MLQEQVKKLTPELTAQLREQWNRFRFRVDGADKSARHLVSVSDIVTRFKYDDHRERFPEHYKTLTRGQVLWLLKHSRDVFEQYEFEGKTYWRLREDQAA